MPYDFSPQGYLKVAYLSSEKEELIFHPKLNICIGLELTEAGLL